VVAWLATTPGVPGVAPGRQIDPLQRKEKTQLINKEPGRAPRVRPHWAQPVRGSVPHGSSWHLLTIGLVAVGRLAASETLDL
jgi:hypothetical protein